MCYNARRQLGVETRAKRAPSLTWKLSKSPQEDEALGTKRCIKGGSRLIKLHHVARGRLVPRLVQLAVGQQSTTALHGKQRRGLCFATH